MGDGEGAALNQLAEDLEWETPLCKNLSLRDHLHLLTKFRFAMFSG